MSGAAGVIAAHGARHDPRIPLERPGLRLGWVKHPTRPLRVVASHKGRLIAVGGRLVGAVLGDADVVGLVVGEDGQFGAQLAQMQLGDLLVELLGEQVHLVGVLHLLLVLAGLVVRLAQLELGEGLVGERVGHDERRVAGGAAEVEQAALGEDDDAVAVGENVLVALRLDVLR